MAEVPAHHGYALASEGLLVMLGLDQDSRTDEGILVERCPQVVLRAIRERFSKLPPEDQEDFREVFALWLTSTGEDEARMGATLAEILANEPPAVRKVDLTVDISEEAGLKKWLDFISKRIRDARTKAKVNQAELAKRSGLRQGYISRLETGKHSPSFVTLQKIAKALGIPVKELDPTAPDDSELE